MQMLLCIIDNQTWIFTLSLFLFKYILKKHCWQCGVTAGREEDWVLQRCWRKPPMPGKSTDWCSQTSMTRPPQHSTHNRGCSLAIYNFTLQISLWNETPLVSQTFLNFFLQDDHPRDSSNWGSVGALQPVRSGNRRELCHAALKSWPPPSSLLHGCCTRLSSILHPCLTSLLSSGRRRSRTDPTGYIQGCFQRIYRIFIQRHFSLVCEKGTISINQLITTITD